MYDFLTRLRDEFEPLHAQLFARYPCVSLIDAIVEVRNEETCLQDANLLRVSSVLGAHFSVARCTTLVRSTSPPIDLSAARGVSTDLYYDHCGRYGHVNVFCYRKKKAQETQTHHSSQGTGASSSGGSEMSSTGSET
jgi:hypothetical protein